MEQREAPASDIISAMTIGITGPGRRVPWRGAVVVLIIAAIVLSICLILLGLTGDFLVDWLWFSKIGYLGVWTTIAAEAEVFFAVFTGTAIILMVNGSIAPRFGASKRASCRRSTAGRRRLHHNRNVAGPDGLQPWRAYWFSATPLRRRFELLDERSETRRHRLRYSVVLDPEPSPNCQQPHPSI